MHSNQQTTIYNYLTPLLVSGISLFSAIYLTILDTNLYTYFVPLCALSFMVSFISFYQVKKKLKESDSNSVHAFYYRAFGIFSLTFLFFFCMTLVYLPFYHEGGSLYVWWYAPTGLLSLIACITSKRELRKNA